MNAKKSEIVLAVCTRDRPAMLQKCLLSLEITAERTSSHVNLIVIDNSTAPETADAIAALCVGRAMYIRERRLGIPFARNSALDYAASAKSDALIFVDDDQIVPADWLDILVATWILQKAQVVKSYVSWNFEIESGYREFFEENRSHDVATIKSGESVSTKRRFN